ncbi:MAG TPA: MarC family protein, partial [Usitatibacteraceae bacterium]|nr:MarC family protein [Usitatibacteraceae bacterium]
LMATRDPDKVGMWAAAITVTMVLTTVVLLAGTKLNRWLGEHAMSAIERLMGLLLTAIAVEMLLAGIRDFVKGLA